MVCDPSKLDERGCKGAPDLVIEILSPATAAKDLKDKFVLYERVGVEEYWIVHPAEKAVTVYRRGSDGQYGRPSVYTAGDRVRRLPTGVGNRPRDGVQGTRSGEAV